MNLYRYATAFAVALFLDASMALGQENCDTALSRLAKGAAEKAIQDHRHSACSGLKSGIFAIDKTQALELRQFRLCEKVPIVRASATVYVRCATSPAAMIPASFDETVTASATADLDTCKVTDTTISSEGEMTNAGIRIAGASDKMRSELEKAIKPYCKQ